MGEMKHEQKIRLINTDVRVNMGIVWKSLAIARLCRIEDAKHQKIVRSYRRKRMEERV
jgi:hypothetical protein